MKNANEYLEIKGIDLRQSLLQLISDAYASGAVEAFSTLEAFEYIKKKKLNEAWNKVSYIIDSD